MGLYLGLERPFLMDFTLEKLQEYLRSHGKKSYLADQVFNWVYQKGQMDPRQWSNISRSDQAFVSEQFTLEVPKIVWSGQSKDGTRKFLLKMIDGALVEAVVIPRKGRPTLCLSTQVGCAIGCTFCHTGTQGLSRHLQAAEIVGQYMAIAKWPQGQSGVNSHQGPGDQSGDGHPIARIVYMGMGEPLHNFMAVKNATTIFLEPQGIAFGQRRITLSTSGLVPQIEKLGEFPPINIAISLHAAHDDIRSQLMPINKRYDLQRLFQAIKSIPLKAHRYITYEYLLIDGLNNRAQDIVALSQLLPRKGVKINLIPFNEYPQSSFKRPSRDKVLWFQEQLGRRGFHLHYSPN